MTTVRGSWSTTKWMVWAARCFFAISVYVCCLVAANFASAAVTATGDFSPNPLEPDSSLQVGTDSYGTLRIDGGSSFQSQYFRIGQQSTGFGIITVTDPGTIWTMHGGHIGEDGYGQLEILNGAIAQAPIADNTTLGGYSGDGYGRLIVDGNGSLLHLNSGLDVGVNNSSGVVEIRNGGIVNVTAQETQFGRGGRLALEGGLLRTRHLTNSGLIAGHGEINVASNGHFYNHGRVEVRDNESLRISSPSFQGLSNEGEFLIDGGKIEILTGFQNDQTCCGPDRSSISLRNAELRVGVAGDGNQQFQLANRGLLTTFGGENHLYGSLRNESNAMIAITNESLAVFHDPVRNEYNATIAVSPDSSALFLQGLEMNGGILLANIAGHDDYGHVEVVGGGQFYGQLQVNLQDGFVPQLGNSFQLLTSTETLFGYLDVVPNQNLSEGLEWEVEFENNAVMLNVVAAAPPVLAGDYNLDGTVNAADYTVWRNAADSGDLSADGDNSGNINGNDYEVWRAHYGESSAGSGGLSTAVPEPMGFAVMLMGAAVLIVTRRSKLA